MPPQQCPACGRFLKQALVASLDAEPAPCPGCDEQLVAAMFEVPDVSDAPDVPAPPHDATTTRAEAAASVRPPDLAPDVVRGEVDVLAGWDVGADADEIASWRADRRPFPTDTVLVLGAGVVGGAIAAAVAGDRRLRAAAAGTTLGLLGGAITRRIWRLTP